VKHIENPVCFNEVGMTFQAVEDFYYCFRVRFCVSHGYTTLIGYVAQLAVLDRSAHDAFTFERN
jgi:hypothetical protein